MIYTTNYTKTIAIDSYSRLQNTASWTSKDWDKNLLEAGYSKNTINSTLDYYTAPKGYIGAPTTLIFNENRFTKLVVGTYQVLE